VTWRKLTTLPAPGAYWCRSPKEHFDPQVVEVRKNGSEQPGGVKVWTLGWDCSLILSLDRCEWIGPLGPDDADSVREACIETIRKISDGLYPHARGPYIKCIEALQRLDLSAPYGTKAGADTAT
jgi:hypothetical protein